MKVKKRKAIVARKTKETDIKIDLTIDGKGKSSISTGMPFFDHMLDLFAKNAMIDLKLKAKGDLEVDYHHTVEDIGLALGQAIDKALGTRRGIIRYGASSLPMDETLANVAIDLGGRPYLVVNMACKKRKILEFDLSLINEFLVGLVNQGRLNLHINQLYGTEAHHAYEACFKGMGRALRQAMEKDPRSTGVPSTKGMI
jgi:imidazoleglycerol-phosphate dehydratase